MQIGLFQFPCTGNISANLQAIERAVRSAAMQGVRLLALHECALCGYPPVETSIDSITPESIFFGLAQVSALAKKYHMHISVGTIRFEPGQRYNSLVLFDDCGQPVGYYDKTALWGWDTDHFTRGSTPGIFEFDGLKIGFRICFDVRFPEHFRSLYTSGADLCIVAFSDTSTHEDPERYNIIKSHLVSRAAENVMTILSVNSTAPFQTAPTAVFDGNGRTLMEAVPGTEQLLIFNYNRPEITFSMRGRITNSDFFMHRK